MERLVILDDFPFWTSYLLAAMVVVGFLSALTLLIRLLRPSQRKYPPPGTCLGADARRGFS